MQFFFSLFFIHCPCFFFSLQSFAYAVRDSISEVVDSHGGLVVEQRHALVTLKVDCAESIFLSLYDSTRHVLLLHNALPIRLLFWTFLYPELSLANMGVAIYDSSLSRSSILKEITGGASSSVVSLFQEIHGRYVVLPPLLLVLGRKMHVIHLCCRSRI